MFALCSLSILGVTELATEIYRTVLRETSVVSMHSTARVDPCGDRRARSKEISPGPCDKFGDGSRLKRSSRAASTKKAPPRGEWRGAYRARLRYTAAP